MTLPLHILLLEPRDHDGKAGCRDDGDEDQQERTDDDRNGFFVLPQPDWSHA